MSYLITVTSNMPKIQQLAAIVFSDISGFTNTMESDEDRAMAQIQKHKEIITNAISEFQCEIFKFEKRKISKTAKKVIRNSIIAMFVVIAKKYVK